ncbi:MAG: ferredoxin [Desulfuromonas sp.]|jgi:NAD-dependent dihydropyrimidine dehydrogenase PreA subunit|nr:MAG: ferredoxin [Desulfuromonas sp.]
MQIIIDPQKCTASGECVVVCPQNAISIQDGVAVVDDNLCDYDGICIPACPQGAISFSE